MNRMAVMAAVTVLLGGCDNLDLERMIDQERVDVYEQSRVFEDRMAMQVPPEGTIPRSRNLAYGPEATGIQDGRYIQQIPIPVTRELLERGRDRFSIFCAACHGVLGNGASKVAENMALRPPPSLLDPPVSGYLPGRLFTIITDGYGLMPSYAVELSRTDRWAVIAYVQALKLSQHANVNELPPQMRRATREALQ